MRHPSCSRQLCNIRDKKIVKVTFEASCCKNGWKNLHVSVLIYLYRVRLLPFSCIHSFIVAQRPQRVCKLVKFSNFSQASQPVLERNTCRSNWSRNKWVWTVFHIFGHYYHHLFQRLPWHLLTLSLSGACDIEVLTLASRSGCAGLWGICFSQGCWNAAAPRCVSALVEAAISNLTRKPGFTELLLLLDKKERLWWSLTYSQGRKPL